MDDDVQLLQQLISHGGTQAFSLVPMALRKVILEQQWRKHVNREGKPFKNFEAFVTDKSFDGLASSIEELMAFCRKAKEVQELILKEMEPGREHVQDEKGRFVHNSNTTMDRGALYTLKRLKRDRPDLFEQVIGGSLSANAAAIEAGWRKKETPLELLQKAWAKASPEERQSFLKEIIDAKSTEEKT